MSERPTAVYRLNRRDFCFLLSGCALAGVSAPGCLEGDSRVIGTEPIGADAGGTPPIGFPDAGTTQPGTPDASVPSAPDAQVPTSQPDAAPEPPGPACTGSPTDLGAPSSFAMDTATLFSSARVFVVRDAGGLYALSSTCTHETVTLGISGTQFRCPRHGATYTRAGAVVSGPVFRGLVHYSMCVLPNGNVAVNTSQTVADSERLAV